MEKLTERLCLREFTAQDVDAIAEFRQDPKYLEFYYRPAYSREECERFVDMCIGWSQERPRCKFQLAITYRSSGALLGDCGVRTDNTGSRRGDIGYELSPIHWGHGYATEAVRGMLDLGFEDLGLDEIEAGCVAANRRSVRLLSRLGFVETERVPPGHAPGEFNTDVLPELCVYLINRDKWIHG